MNFMTGELRVPIEASARHVHVTKEALAVLFGENAELHNVRELSQPGQYLTEEKLRVEGPRGAIDRFAILGPERAATQVKVTGDPITLDAMQPFERRAIHLALQDDPAVTTGSIGEEPDRRVVVAPATRDE